MIVDFSKQVEFDIMRKAMGEFFLHSLSSKRFWDLIVCMRGPDTPSERGDMSGEEGRRAYNARRARKRETVEVIRGRAFGGIVPGAARYRIDRDYVVVSAEGERDHFDRHVINAALSLGLEVKSHPKKRGKKVKAVTETSSGMLKTTPSEVDYHASLVNISKKLAKAKKSLKPPWILLPNSEPADDPTGGNECPF